MANTLAVKDATGTTLAVAVQDNGAAGLVPVHVEDTAQRAALLALLGTHATEGKLEAVRALLAGAATEAKLEAVRALLASTIAVSGPLTAAQLGSAALASSAKQDAGNTALAAIQAALAATLKADSVIVATSTNKGASVGTTAQVLMAANSARRGFVVQNQSTTATIYINGLGTATADYNSLAIGPGIFYDTAPHHIGTGAISIIASSASTPVYAREF